MAVLDKITSYEDIRKLDEAELPALCAELRQIVVETTAKNGGHLASNLGVTELTVAIHRVFNTSRDRTFGGLSGFPKPSESEHDAFVAGHASSAISTALGMARARTLRGEDYAVIALVGDGALTGGLAYEGLAAAARSQGVPLAAAREAFEMEGA